MYWQILLVVFLLVLFGLLEYFCHVADRETEAYDNSDLVHHLEYFHDKFTSHKVKYWLMNDTLLDAVKNKDLNHLCNGLDFGVGSTDEQWILALDDLIKKDGYRFVKSYVMGIEYPTRRQKIIWRVSLKILYHKKQIGDIYFFTLFPDGLVRRYEPKDGVDYWPSLNTFPAWFIDRLEVVRVRNREYPAPRDASVLLDYWYGPKWRHDIKTAKNLTRGKPHRLQDLLDHVREKTGTTLVATASRVKYTYPIDEIVWIKENDPPRGAVAGVVAGVDGVVAEEGTIPDPDLTSEPDVNAEYRPPNRRR